MLIGDVPIIRSASVSVVDMLIFPLSVIGTKSLGSQYKYQYNSHKLFLFSPQIELTRILKIVYTVINESCFCIEYLTSLHKMSSL